LEEQLAGRYTTLQKLDRDLKRPDLGKYTKQRIKRARDGIVEQLKDKKLNKLREELIRATRANDREEIWKITCRIREHEGKPLEERFE
jgi:hypothetical protein